MKTWKSNLEETKQRYINWWNHKGIILNMWEHFQEGAGAMFLLTKSLTLISLFQSPLVKVLFNSIKFVFVSRLDNVIL